MNQHWTWRDGPTGPGAAVVVDIDGVLSDAASRQHYLEEERPDWRGTLQANLSLGRFTSLGRVSYYGSFSSAQPGFCDLCREEYGAKTVVDAELGYGFNFVRFAIGARNLLDIYPDQPSSQVIVDEFGDTSQNFNDNFGTFPWAAASPFGYNGRYVYARTEIQFGW